MAARPCRRGRNALSGDHLLRPDRRQPRAVVPAGSRDRADGRLRPVGVARAVRAGASRGVDVRRVPGRGRRLELRAPRPPRDDRARARRVLGLLPRSPRLRPALRRGRGRAPRGGPAPLALRRPLDLPVRGWLRQDRPGPSGRRRGRPRHPGPRQGPVLRSRVLRSTDGCRGPEVPVGPGQVPAESRPPALRACLGIGDASGESGRRVRKGVHHGTQDVGPADQRRRRRARRRVHHRRRARGVRRELRTRERERPSRAAAHLVPAGRGDDARGDRGGRRFRRSVRRERRAGRGLLAVHRAAPDRRQRGRDLLRDELRRARGGHRPRARSRAPGQGRHPLQG